MVAENLLSHFSSFCFFQKLSIRFYRFYVTVTSRTCRATRFLISIRVTISKSETKRKRESVKANEVFPKGNNKKKSLMYSLQDSIVYSSFEIKK